MMTKNDDNVLSKMVLLSPAIFERVKNQMKVDKATTMFKNKMHDVLGNQSLNDNEKWLQYRQWLIRQYALAHRNNTARSVGGAASDLPQHGNFELMRKNNEASLDLKRSMNRVLHNDGKRLNPSDKWLAYRHLLTQKAIQKRIEAKDLNSMNKNNETPANAFSNRLKKASLAMLNRDLQNIMLDRKLKNSEKWLKYRSLLIKHNLLKRNPADWDLALEEMNQGLKKYRFQERGVQTVVPEPPSRVNRRIQTETKQKKTLATQTETDELPYMGEQIFVNEPTVPLTTNQEAELRKQKLALTERYAQDSRRLRHSQWAAEDAGEIDPFTANMELDKDTALHYPSTPTQYPNDLSFEGTPALSYSTPMNQSARLSFELMNPSMRKERARVRALRNTLIAEETAHADLQNQEQQQQTNQTTPVSSKSLSASGGVPHVRSLRNELMQMTPVVKLKRMKTSDLRNMNSQITSQSQGENVNNSPNNKRVKSKRRRSNPREERVRESTENAINTVTNYYKPAKRVTRSATRNRVQTGQGSLSKLYLNPNIITWERY